MTLSQVKIVCLLNFVCLHIQQHAHQFSARISASLTVRLNGHFLYRPVHTHHLVYQRIRGAFCMAHKVM